MPKHPVILYDAKKEEWFQDPNWHDRPLLLPPPIWHPKQPQMAPITSPNLRLRRFSRANKLLFKSLLEPSWADLGAFRRPSWGPKKRSGIGIRNIWWKFTFLMKISFQNTFWTELGPTWPPKRPNMAPRWRPKTPNIDQSFYMRSPNDLVSIIFIVVYLKSPARKNLNRKHDNCKVQSYSSSFFLPVLFENLGLELLAYA